MPTERCYICERVIWEEDFTYCAKCESPICDDHVRVPEDEHQVDPVDYCIPCYIQQGYGEVWEVDYVTMQGDILKMSFDTPVNTCSFLIPGYAKQMGGMFKKVANFHKVTDTRGVSDYVTKYL